MLDTHSDSISSAYQSGHQRGHEVLGRLIYGVLCVIPAAIVYGYSGGVLGLPIWVSSALALAAAGAYLYAIIMYPDATTKLLGGLLAATLLGECLGFGAWYIGVTSPLYQSLGFGTAVLVLYAHFRPTGLAEDDVLWGVCAGAILGGIVYLFSKSPDAACLFFACTSLVMMLLAKEADAAARAQPYVPPHLRRGAGARSGANRTARQPASEDNYGINPATNLPMQDDSFDIAGNLFMMGGAALATEELSNMYADSFSHHHTDTEMHLDTDSGMHFNPANGLPMMSDAFDIEGNLYMTDNSHHTDTTYDFGSSFTDTSMDTSYDFGSTDTSFDSSSSFSDTWSDSSSSMLD